MNRSNFEWCVSQCKGKPELRTEVSSTGWNYQFRCGIVLHAQYAPRRDMYNKIIGCSTEKECTVQDFLGACTMLHPKNKAALARRDKALVKYQRWLEEMDKQ